MPIWGEVELAARFLPPGALVLGVTGTNGKSTTTALLGALCEAGGLDAFVGGNLGTPLARAVLEAPRRTYVLELSSFQLEGMETVRVHGAAVLNLTPDHLDRYDGLEDYAAAKARIFGNQEPGDVAVVNADDRRTLGMVDGARGRRFGFTLRRGQPPPPGLAGLAEPIEGGFQLGFAGLRFRLANRALRGGHNLANAMAATLLAFHAGVARRRAPGRARPLPRAPTSARVRPDARRGGVDQRLEGHQRGRGAHGARRPFPRASGCG